MLSHPVPRLTTPRIAAAFLATAGCLCAWAASAQTLPIPFTHQLVDAAPPAQTHAKGAGDVDGDGLPDLLIAGARDGDGLYWYAAPDWTRHVIVPPGVAGFTTDMKAGDVDGDGDLDVVIPKGFHIGDSVWWYENPRPAGDPAADTWTEHFIGSGGAHDVEIGDVDGDGSLDVLTRHDGTTLFLQTGPDAWATTVLSTRTEEGAGFGDLDGDGDLDVAINGFWLENPLPDQRPEIGPWLEHAIDPSWPPDAKVEVADLDADGRSDVLISRSEAAGGRLAWYGAIDPRLGPWTEHVIDPTADHNHSLQVGDLDRDGDLDVVAAEMHQSPGEDEVRIFFNEGGALGWTEQIVDAKGSHNLRLVDVDRDGDLDLYGANWHGETGVDLWLNGVRNPGDSLPLDRWVRHSIDPDLPWRALLLAAGDIDLDGDPDIATGGWWYENPGAVSGLWTRREIGAPLYNLAALLDLDGDGDLDVLGTNGQPSGGALSWARNDGSGSFESLPGLPSSTGDFLQGVATGRFAPAGPVQVVLSWHAGAALELLTPPADPAGPGWTLEPLPGEPQLEDLSAADLDGDGDLDLFQGTRWLRNDAGAWTGFVANPVGGLLDRHGLSDIDGDGDPDAVVGFEGTSTELIWLEHPESATQTWPLHSIATGLGGGHSLGVADFDGDGDADVALGEHHGETRLLVFENRDSGSVWLPHLVDAGGAGIDHHDGTLPVDLDGDGDLDIASIGWFEPKLWIFENLALGAAPPPAPPLPPPGDAPEDVASGLVMHLPFDEGSGGHASDDSGNGNHGALENMTEAAWIDADLPPSGTASSHALAFDGSDDFVDAGSFDVGAPALTLAAWFKADRFAHLPHHDGRLLSKATGTAAADHDWMLSTIRSGSRTRLRFRVRTAGTTRTLIASSRDLEPGVWIHAAAVYDGSEMRLYADGELVGRAAAGGALAASGEPVWVGGNPASATSRPWDGLIDDVRVYERALTPAQIRFLRDDGPEPPPVPPSDPPPDPPPSDPPPQDPPPADADLRAHWPLDDAGGALAADLSGHGHDGTLMGDPAWSDGRLGGALDLDGVGDFVDAGPLIPGGATALSAAAWVRKRDGGDDRVICQASGTAVADHVFSLGVSGTTFRVRLHTTGNGGTANYDGGAIPLDRWVHLAFSYDGAALRLYRDGVETAAFGVSGDVLASDQPVVLGNVNATQDRFWNGRLDDVRLYERALTPEEIASLAQPQP